MKLLNRLFKRPNNPNNPNTPTNTPIADPNPSNQSLEVTHTLDLGPLNDLTPNQLEGIMKNLASKVINERFGALFAGWEHETSGSSHSTAATNAKSEVKKVKNTQNAPPSPNTPPSRATISSILSAGAGHYTIFKDKSKSRAKNGGSSLYYRVRLKTDGGWKEFGSWKTPSEAKKAAAYALNTGKKMGSITGIRAKRDFGSMGKVNFTLSGGVWGFTASFGRNGDSVWLGVYSTYKDAVKALKTYNRTGVPNVSRDYISKVSKGRFV